MGWIGGYYVFVKVHVELDVELCAIEDAERDDKEPEEQSDGCAEGTIDTRVVGKTRDIPAKTERGKKPHHGRDDSSRNDAFPRQTDGRSHVIEEGDKPDAAGKSDCPANEKRDEKDRRTDGGHNVSGEPGCDEMPEDNE